MKKDPLQQYIALRAALATEKTRLEQRLAEINRALDLEAPKPQARGTPRAENTMSLREAVTRVTKDKALTKPEILEGVQKLGYKFTAKDPTNSLNVLLYSGNFKNLGNGTFKALKKGKGEI